MLSYPYEGDNFLFFVMLSMTLLLTFDINKKEKKYAIALSDGIFINLNQTNIATHEN